MRQLSSSFGLGKATFDDNFVNYEFVSAQQEHDFLKQVAQHKVVCPACKNAIESEPVPTKGKRKSIPKLSLGVSERIDQIATWEFPHHPDHCPPYLDIVPLIEVLRALQNILSKTSKSLVKSYNELISTFGTEFSIIADIDLEKLRPFMDGKLANVIEAFRNHNVHYIPGGGGTFGQLHLDDIDE